MKVLHETTRKCKKDSIKWVIDQGFQWQYRPLHEAILERSNLESRCAYAQCSLNDIKSNSGNKWNSLFGSIFPSYTEDICNIFNWYKRPGFKNAADTYFLYKNQQIASLPYFNPFPCQFGYFDINSCPLITKRTSGLNNLLYEKELCRLGPHLNEVYAEPCNKLDLKNCMDTFIAKVQKYPYFKNDPKLQDLIRRYQANYMLDLPKFDTEEEFTEKVRRMISYQIEESTTNDLPLPLVKTTMIYTTTLSTSTAYLYNDDPKVTDFDNYKDVYYKGGDDSVNSFSSFAVGLKWQFDLKLLNKPRDSLQFVEYCSSSSRFGNGYRANNLKDLQQPYLSVPCSCIDENGLPINNKKMASCGHAQIINDKPLINFIEQFLYSSTPKTSPDIITAVNKYNDDIDYVGKCNQNFFKLSDL
jgi:hypothetical protein